MKSIKGTFLHKTNCEETSPLPFILLMEFYDCCVLQVNFNFQFASSIYSAHLPTVSRSIVKLHNITIDVKSYPLLYI
jgi:hypothetical protein